ncbi:DoxX family protein [Sandaracinus amylolyticus]|uniref:DoxX family protein n=2 Tax=Sandaracinus TaxID=1055688 RepID=UPI0019D47E6A|nr:DoxX family protein [Sandaracinus amylolyticus]QRN75774.1 Hypothetical protein MSR10575_88610 [Sandaracinus sp.]UJR87286.1 Hypothetical protein I5071_780 [Sandaracinus amylolyticus]
MNLVLWILQVALALLYLAAGGMKVFTLEKAQEDFPSMKALPNAFWNASGILEMVCSVGLIVPSAFHIRPMLTPGFATVLAIEAVVLSGRHVKLKETSPAIWSGIFAAAAAFVAYGRIVVSPIL